jgi:hypothetical protein
MKKKEQKIQYIEIPITKKPLNGLVKSLYRVITGKNYPGFPAMVGDEISITLHGFKEIVLKFKVVKDSYSPQELRDLFRK